MATTSLALGCGRPPSEGPDPTAGDEEQHDHAADDDHCGVGPARLARRGLRRREAGCGLHAVTVSGLVRWSQERVVVPAVLDEPDAVRLRLRPEAPEQIGAEGFTLRRVDKGDVRRLVEDDLLHLVDVLLTRGEIGLLPLLLIQGVVLLVAEP